MRVFIAASLLGSGYPVAASPIAKRALSPDAVSVLQLAHYLELLGLSLYTGGCNNFTDAQYNASGFPAGFRENVYVIASVRSLYT